MGRYTKIRSSERVAFYFSTWDEQANDLVCPTCFRTHTEVGAIIENHPRFEKYEREIYFDVCHIRSKTEMENIGFPPEIIDAQANTLAACHLCNKAQGDEHLDTYLRRNQPDNYYLIWTLINAQIEWREVHCKAGSAMRREILRYEVKYPGTYNPDRTASFYAYYRALKNGDARWFGV